MGMVGSSDLGLTLWYLGYPAQAVERFDEALKLAQDHAHALSLAQVLNFGVILHACRRDQPTVKKQAEAQIALATEHALALHLARGLIHRGWILAMQGSVEEGFAQLQEGLASYRATGAEVFMTYLLALLAEVYGKRGQAEEGLTALDEALAFVENNSERHFESEIHRLKGELRQKLSSNNVAEAENCFHQARQIARRQRVKSLELRAAISLSRLWQQQGKRDEAYQLLGETYDWFTEGFDTADLKEAKVLLEELSD
jgi:predicted ATPase